MAFGSETDAEKIKPLEGAIVRRFTAGVAITAGMPVAMASDGYVDPADGSDVTLSWTLGIALQTVAAGQRVDVVTFGPCNCVLEATPGALYYVSDTAGAISATAGTKSTIIGVAESAAVIFVHPQFVALS